MYAGFVREGVASDNGFVRLNAEADDLREHLAGRIDFPRVDSGFKSEPITAHVQRHHYLFQRCVAGALADAVDGALDLPCTGVDRGETVRNCETEIVMTVDANGNVLSIAHHTLADRAHQSREFIGESVTHSIRHIENRRAFFHCGVEYFAQILHVAARRVLSRKLNFFSQVASQTHRAPGHFDNFGAGFFQFVFEVDIRSRADGVDAWAGCFTQSLGRSANVRFHSSA